MDPVAIRRSAQHVTIRLLLSDLYVLRCMGADDPVAEAGRLAGLKLNAADWLAETSPGSDDFKHALLHELETFWSGVQTEVRERVRRGL